MTAFFQYFDGGAGPPAEADDMAINASITPATYRLTNPFAQSAPVRSFVAQYQQQGPFRSDQFASFGAALTNGISIFGRERNDILIGDLTAFRVVKTNADWGFYTSENVSTFAGNGPTLLEARIATFSNPALQMPPGSYFEIVIRDDLSMLDFFRAFIRFDVNDT